MEVGIKRKQPLYHRDSEAAVTHNTVFVSNFITYLLNLFENLEMQFITVILMSWCKINNNISDCNDKSNKLMFLLSSFFTP